MLSIYQFGNPKDYLAQVLEEKKRKNPQFSLRSWAKQMGFQSHNSLYQVIKGERSMPKSFLPKLQGSLKLNAKELRYLETLIDLNKAKDIKEKEMYLEKLRKISPLKKQSFTEIQNYQFFRDPLKAAIAELALSKGFKANPAWIQRRLVMKVHQTDIQKAIDCLKSLDILIEGENGELIRKDINIKSQDDVRNLALQEYHQKLCAIASEQVSQQDVNDREYRGYLFNIKKDKLSQAKERMRDFLEEFSRDFEAEPAQKSETYCLQANLFSLTKENMK